MAFDVCGPLFDPIFPWWDRNRDGLFTVSDIWPSIEWLFFLPSQAIIWSLISSNLGLASFFEFTCISWRGVIAFLLSLLSWGSAVYALIFCIMIVVAFISTMTDLLFNIPKILKRVIVFFTEAFSAFKFVISNPSKAIAALVNELKEFFVFSFGIIFKVATRCLFAPWFLGLYVLAQVKKAKTTNEKIQEGIALGLGYLCAMVFWAMLVWFAIAGII